MLKKIIRKAVKFKRETRLSPFWLWIHRKEKIRRLGNELDAMAKEIKAAPDSDFVKIYRIAQEQQKLLQKK
jgi:hypothetical protein